VEIYHRLLLKNTYKEFSVEIPKRQLDRLTNCFVMFQITYLRYKCRNESDDAFVKSGAIFNRLFIYLYNGSRHSPIFYCSNWTSDVDFNGRNTWNR